MKINTTRLEIRVAKLYIFFLPFRMIMPFEWLQGIIGPLANYFDLIFHLWGLILWLQNERGFHYDSLNKPLFSTIRNAVVYLNVSSVIMACVMYYLYGNYYGHSPFFGVVPMILFYFQYLFMFLYNIRVFSLIDYDDMVNILSRTCRVLLILGYVQVAVLLGIGASSYDLMAQIVGGLQLSSEIGKLPLTGTEGAAAGSLLGVFVFPFLFAKSLHGYKNSMYEIFLWLVPLYFTHSSTAMLLFILSFFMFLFFVSRYSMKRTKYIRRIVGVGSILVVSCALLLYSNIIDTEVTSEIDYLVFEKAVDDDNGSVAARSVPFILSWGCFQEMPILGVGNGLQGYFFDKYFPLDFLNYPSMDYFYEKRHEGIGNAGAFFPGYFSGYGIVGLIVLMAVVKKLKRTLRLRKGNLGLFYEMFLIGGICCIPNGLQGDFYCLYYVWFVLSIPFMLYNLNGRQNG